MKNHDYYMRLALDLALDAKKENEIPVGCVIIESNGTVIGSGYNHREQKKNAIAHAEIEAISNACVYINDWRLTGCSLYVTLEPCPMCAGAIIMSRISKVFFGAKDEISGSCGSVINIFMEPYGHKVQVTGGILTDECSALLSDFFKEQRK